MSTLATVATIGFVLIAMLLSLRLKLQAPVQLKRDGINCLLCIHIRPLLHLPTSYWAFPFILHDSHTHISILAGNKKNERNARSS